jgi:hypothetical protein
MEFGVKTTARPRGSEEKILERGGVGVVKNIYINQDIRFEEIT